MNNYIDGYAFPLAQKHLTQYKAAAEDIAHIWKEHGALAYIENVSDGETMDGLPTFPNLLTAKPDETIIFGWIIFESKEARNLAHERVAADPRMATLVAPLMNPSSLIFDVSRMVFGGFTSLVNVSTDN